jgi:two-component system, NtrC family, response regulator AtoC
MSLLLIAAHEPVFRERLVDFFRAQGHAVTSASNGVEAIAQLHQQCFDAILTEVNLPGRGGVDVLHAALKRDAQSAVVMLAGPDDVPTALEALKQGAWDYVFTPSLYLLDEVGVRMEKALQYRRMRRTAHHLHHTQSPLSDGAAVIGQSARLHSLLAPLRHALATNSPLLITGEPGTGKSLLAAALHGISTRRSQAFVMFHCAPLAEHLLDSELFGHEQGAFPGANEQRIGCTEQAHLGTLFLHHITALPPTLQTKVLRLLQERTFARLGSSVTMHCDVRIVAATHETLPHAVRTGRFRPDLYERLSAIRVEMPALRDCRDDILPLARYFLQRYSRLFGRRVCEFDPAAQRSLLTYPWPGNLRELQHTIARGVLLEDNELMRLANLRLDPGAGASGDDRDSIVKLPPRGTSLREIERQALLQALQHTNWVQKEAAVHLDISPRVMHYKLKTHGITHPKWSRRR